MMRILQTESLFSMLALLQKRWWMPCFVCMIGVDTWLLLGVTTTANQQVRLCRIFTFWRWIRLIGSSTWCRIAGFVPFTDNLFMKRENLAVSSQYPPCPYMESFPLPAWIFCYPPRCISVSKIALNFPGPPLPFLFPFQRRRPQWSLSSLLPDDNGSRSLSSLSRRSRVDFVVFHCSVGWRSCTLHHRREGDTWLFAIWCLYRELVRPKSKWETSCSTSDYSMLNPIWRVETFNLLPTLKSYSHKSFIPLPQVRYLLAEQDIDIATARSCLHNIYQLMRITFHVPAIRPMADPRISGGRIRFGTILVLSLLFSVVDVSASLSQLYCSNQNTGADFTVGKIFAQLSHKLQSFIDQILQLLQSTSPMVNALIPAFRITPLRSFSIKSAGVLITSRPGQHQLAPVIKTVRAIQMSNVDLLRMGCSDISP